MKLIPWVLKSRKAKVDEAHALSTRDTCSDIVSLESSTTPSTLSVDTVSAPSMNGRSGSILGLDLGRETSSSLVFDGCTFILLLLAHCSMLLNSSLIVPMLVEPTNRYVSSANFVMAFCLLRW